MRMLKVEHPSPSMQVLSHPVTTKLRTISRLLDEQPKILDLAGRDLLSPSKERRGAKGMSVEQVLRAAMVMHRHHYTYAQLEFHLHDSPSLREFVRLPEGVSYSDSCLQSNIKKLRDETWEQINQLLVKAAAALGIETGRVTRTDSTVVESNIHHPNDASLLIDCLAVIFRVYKWLQAQGLKLAKLPFSFRRARRLFLKIINTKNETKRKELYKKLLVGAGEVWQQLDALLEAMSALKGKVPATTLQTQEERLQRMQAYLECVLAQTIARVIDDQKLDASEKLVSVFEEHTDIIVKGQREVEFGHKVNVTTGESGLVIDATVDEGNPSDKSKYLEMLERQSLIYGEAPLQTSCDGGYASKENTEEAKARGVKDVCFSKPCGQQPEELCQDQKTYKKLRKFRAGVEGNISTLKRAFGLKRAYWKGYEGFKSWVWSGIVAYNLSLIARFLCS